MILDQGVDYCPPGGIAIPSLSVFRIFLVHFDFIDHRRFEGGQTHDSSIGNASS